VLAFAGPKSSRLPVLGDHLDRAVDVSVELVKVLRGNPVLQKNPAADLVNLDAVVKPYSSPPTVVKPAVELAAVDL
jgi:hypothetical protein